MTKEVPTRCVRSIEIVWRFSDVLRYVPLGICVKGTSCSPASEENRRKRDVNPMCSEVGGPAWDVVLLCRGEHRALEKCVRHV